MRKTLAVFLIVWILGVGNWLRGQDPSESSKITAPDSPQQLEQPNPFPSSEEFRSKSKIQLVRHGCYGSCPRYTVTVFGNGKVVYQGAEFVRIKGHAKATISRKAVDDLIAKINKVDFFALQPKRVEACVEDGPHAGITISEPGQQREIEDQCLEGNEVEELENAVDKAAQTQQWIFINAREMQNEIDRGWDVTEHGEEYARQAIDWDDPEILQVLIKNGVPVETQDQEGRTLLLEAVSRNRYELAKTLLELGANPKARDKGGWGLAQGAGAGSVEMCKLLLAHGATIDGQDGFG